MSNALAIAAVTAVLKDLLNNGLVGHDLGSTVGVVNVTAKPPDLVVTSPEEAAQLNLFLYRVTPNTGWRNVGLPSRDEKGDPVTNPPLALDLHYLLTAYGGGDFQPEIMMGYAMQILHETPFLSRDAIRTALSQASPVGGGALPPAYQSLSAADLADQIEMIKISPEPLSIEDLSKLWSAFQTSHYRLTTAYQASVVLIQSKRSTRSSLPVRKPKIYVMPFNQPLIEQVSSDAKPGEDPRITVANTLVVKGKRLKGQITRLRVGDSEVSPSSVSDIQISLPLAPLTSLRTGIQGVQIIHELLIGEPEAAHKGVESNVAAFVLHPTITPAVTPGTVVSTAENGMTFFSATIGVTFAPSVGKTQRVTLLLNEFDPPAVRPPRSYSFSAPKDNGIVAPAQTETSSIAFPVKRVSGGTYLVRVQVDGAESILGDTAGKYDFPRITIS